MRPRRLGGEQATIMVSAQVLTVAVPMPCRKRRPMTVSMPGQKTVAVTADVSSSMPHRQTRLRPHLSPALPMTR